MANRSKAASDSLNSRDRAHLAEYLTLLHAKGEGRSDAEMARDICGIDPVAEPDRARRVLAARLARAQWLADNAEQLLLDVPPGSKQTKSQRKRLR